MSSDDVEYFCINFSDYYAQIKVIARLDTLDEIFISKHCEQEEPEIWHITGYEVSGTLTVFHCNGDFSASFFNTFNMQKEAEDWHRYLTDNHTYYLLVEGCYGIYFEEKFMDFFDPKITISERAIPYLEPYNFTRKSDGQTCLAFENISD
jgi:hypothetical protein